MKAVAWYSSCQGDLSQQVAKVPDLMRNHGHECKVEETDVGYHFNTDGDARGTLHLIEMCHGKQLSKIYCYGYPLSGLDESDRLALERYGVPLESVTCGELPWNIDRRIHSFLDWAYHQVYPTLSTSNVPGYGLPEPKELMAALQRMIDLAESTPGHDWQVEARVFSGMPESDRERQLKPFMDNCRERR